MRYDGRHVYGVLVLYAEKEMLLCHPTKPEYANVSVRVVVNESRGAKQKPPFYFYLFILKREALRRCTQRTGLAGEI